MEEIITSLQNQKVKQIIHLRDRKDRDETGLFLIEGYRELLRYLENQGKLDALFICEEFFLGSNEKTLIKGFLERGATVYNCSKQVFQKISYRDRPDGLLGIAPQKKLTFKDLEKKLEGKTPFLVVAEAIEKPGNLGTILRSCDGSGAHGLILVDKCTDLFNPNVVRASVGTLFSVPVVEATSEEALSWLKEKGIEILAATPSAKVDFTKVDCKKPIAIAVGTEQLGLSPLWMNEASIQVKIPMRGAADSLNVAMATTLLLYEVDRQRNI